LGSTVHHEQVNTLRPGEADGPTGIGRAVRARRLELGWTQQHLASEARVSLATVRKVETGDQPVYRALTRHGLCRALGWPSDALRALAPAGEPDLPVTRNERPDERSLGASGEPSRSPDPAGGPDDIELLAAFGGTLAQLSDAERAEVLKFARKLAGSDD
jgi:transcriptional regulator with XRE-family HTH domain